MHVGKLLTYVLFGNERKSKCKQKDYCRTYLGYSRKNTCKYFASNQIIISARPRSAEYKTGICFETAPSNDSSLDSSFPYWSFNTAENLYSLKSWMWLATVACVCVEQSVMLFSMISCFTRMCNWNYWHKHRARWFSELVKLNREKCRVQIRLFKP